MINDTCTFFEIPNFGFKSPSKWPVSPDNGAAAPRSLSVIYTIALLLRERVLWRYLTRILEAVMGFNNAFSYRDGIPLLGDKLRVKLPSKKSYKCVVLTYNYGFCLCWVGGGN